MKLNHINTKPLQTYMEDDYRSLNFHDFHSEASKVTFVHKAGCKVGSLYVGK
jgi:hypothetical protein